LLLFKKIKSLLTRQYETRAFFAALLVNTDFKSCDDSAALYRYRNASKTDVKCSWLKHPKSSMPKEIRTVQELHPPSKPEYRCD